VVVLESIEFARALKNDLRLRIDHLQLPEPRR
jgi:hypothetical protein